MTHSDIEVVDALCRLQLAAKRVGGSIRVEAPPELRAVIDLCGLSGVLIDGTRPDAEPEEQLFVEKDVES